MRPKTDPEGTLHGLLAMEPFPSRFDLLDYALGEAVRSARCNLLDDHPEASVYAVEFGVWGGRSLGRIAGRMGDRLPGATCIGFDSFRGLPEPWHTGVGKPHEAGHFDVGGRIPLGMPKNVFFVVGEFANTLRHVGLYGDTQYVVFAHVDCDLYSSSAVALRWLERGGIAMPGAVIVFDELCDFGGRYPGWRDGEWRAFAESCERGFLTFSPIGRTNQEQVAFRVTPRWWGGE